MAQGILGAKRGAPSLRDAMKAFQDIVVLELSLKSREIHQLCQDSGYFYFFLGDGTLGRRTVIYSCLEDSKRS